MRASFKVCIGLAVIALVTVSYIIASISGGGRIRVETDKLTYSIGEDVMISFYVVNDKPIGATFDNLDYHLEITGSAGTVLSMVVNLHLVAPVTVGANSEYKLGVFVWNQVDMTRTQVTPGSYTIHVRLSRYDVSGERIIQITAAPTFSA